MPGSIWLDFRRLSLRRSLMLESRRFAPFNDFDRFSLTPGADHKSVPVVRSMQSSVLLCISTILDSGSVPPPIPPPRPPEGPWRPERKPPRRLIRRPRELALGRNRLDGRVSRGPRPPQVPLAERERREHDGHSPPLLVYRACADYSKMMQLTDDLGRKVFQTIEITLVCDECLKTVRQEPASLSSPVLLLTSSSTARAGSPGTVRLMSTHGTDKRSDMQCSPLRCRHKLASMPRWLSSQKVRDCRVCTRDHVLTRSSFWQVEVVRKILAEDPAMLYAHPLNPRPGKCRTMPWAIGWTAHVRYSLDRASETSLCWL